VKFREEELSPEDKKEQDELVQVRFVTLNFVEEE
jgi:hypothetical protein